ncbi:MAG: hypothetical protein SH821_00315 [Phototrophicales bacterium]|nr:hypothetical protein [Phototrophicales bacterium]
MRFPISLTLISATIVTALIVVVGVFLIQPPRPLLISATSSLTTISPDANGLDDATQFSYEISRNAFVSLVFIRKADGREFYFRQDERRAFGEYSVLFSGVVDGYLLPNETLQGEVLRRLIPSGDYDWVLHIRAQEGDETAEQRGTLTVVGDEVTLPPQMMEFTLSPEIFTPNQDGIDDRTLINVYLDKEAELDVYLIDGNNQRLPMFRREESRLTGESGRHTYDYEGGVDIGADPPPDGVYTIVAEARDLMGQITKREAQLTIRDGGKPIAEIVGQPNGATVVFVTAPYDDQYTMTMNQTGTLIAKPNSADDASILPITMRLGDLLVFSLTIENYGATPIRTSGPPPGTVYDQTQLAASLGQYDQSGVWRVGIQCETSEQSYPWRWAIGSADELVAVQDPTNDNVYYYLLPGQRAVVWGAIRMTELIPTANPQACWAGLIHEDVSVYNSGVGQREIELLPVE